MIQDNEIKQKIKDLKNEANRRYKNADKEKWQGYYKNYYTTHKEQIKKNQQKYWERKARQELEKEEV